MFDEQVVAEARRSKQTAEGWIAWLRSMSWSYFAEGGTAQSVTASTLLRIVTEWLMPYHPSVYAAVGVQQGPAHQKYHAHILVGGVPRNASMESALRGSWIRRGTLWLDRYHHRQGGVEYLVRQAEEIEVIGTLKPFHVGTERVAT